MWANFVGVCDNKCRTRNKTGGVKLSNTNENEMKMSSLAERLFTRSKDTVGLIFQL